MPIFKPGDVVRAPFPYTDRTTVERRPALIVSLDGQGPSGALVWAVMITSAANRPWSGDLMIGDLDLAGLPAPSVIRCAKIATVEATRLERIGSIDSLILARVHDELERILGLTSATKVPR